MKLILLILLTSFLYGANGTDSVNGTEDFKFLTKYIESEEVEVIKNSTFTVGFSTKYKTPIWTIQELNSTNVNIKSNRNKLCKFKQDTRISPNEQATLNNYRGSNYDRGHISSYASSDFTTKGAKESCYLSNIAPQLPQFNRVIWRKIETRTRDIAKTKNIEVITVVFFDNNPFNDRFMKGNIKVPDAFAKIILHDKEIVKIWFIEHK